MVSGLSDLTIARLRQAASEPELDARYTLTGVVGRGGSATVYGARDAVLEREVAIKVVDIGAGDGEAAARLAREALILSRLDHPGIVPIHDRGLLPDGRAFYVMKLVKGRRFDEAAMAAPSLPDRLALYERVLETVAFAHAQGVVHRDLTPANILVGAFGEVLVMDWGAAWSDGAAEPAGLIVGTPGFMAPEQEQGAAADARTDIFALGRLLAALSGDDAPPALRAVAARASEALPGQRYAAVEALADDLRRYRRGDPPLAYAEPWTHRLERWYRRYEVPTLLVLAYVLMRAGILLWQEL